MSSTLHSGQVILYPWSSALSDLPGLENVIPQPGILCLEVLCILQLGWEKPLWGRFHTPHPGSCPKKQQRESDPWPAYAVGIISSDSKSLLGLTATVAIDLCYSECFLLFPLADF